MVLLFFGRSPRSLARLRLNARGRSDYFLGRLAHGGVRGVRAGTRRPRTHGGTTRVFSSLFRLVVAVVFVVFLSSSSSFCVETTHHPSIDRSTVVVSRYWTPRATGERKRGGGVVARVARTLSNNTNNLLVVIHHSSETKSVARGGIGRGFGNAGKTLWKRGEKSVGEEIQTSKI